MAFPLEDFGDAIVSDDISLAYMSIKDLNLHIDTIQGRSINTSRFAVLQALLNNTVWTFKDERKGDLSVQPLANGDTVTYPAVLGSEDEATENHYLVSGYTVANISNTNDPFPTIVNELSEHFGQSAQGEEIAVFFGSDQTAKIEALAGFESVADRHIQLGANANEVVGLPANTPGVVKGRHESGAWGIEWRRLPATYIVAIHLEQPKPLIKRVDEAKTGLEQGLAW